MLFAVLAYRAESSIINILGRVKKTVKLIFKRKTSARGIRIKKVDKGESKRVVDFVDEHLHNLYHDSGFISCGRIYDHIHRGNVWVAKRNGRILGIAIGKKDGGLWNIVVHKNFREQGIGSMLIKEIDPAYVRIKCKGGLPDPTLFYVKNGYIPADFVKSEITNRKTLLLAVKKR